MGLWKSKEPGFVDFLHFIRTNLPEGERIHFVMEYLGLKVSGGKELDQQEEAFVADIFGGDEAKVNQFKETSRQYTPHDFDSPEPKTKSILDLFWESEEEGPGKEGS